MDCLAPFGRFGTKTDVLDFGSLPKSNFSTNFTTRPWIYIWFWGNTYQNALAHYRVSRNQECFSLDLGVIRSVGYAAENREVLKNIRQIGFKGIREAEFHTVLDYLCNPSLPLPSPSASHIVLGLEIPHKFKNRSPSECSHIR